MPKFKNPPQGGEKYICLTLFLTMMMSVVSAVAMIYSIVIIYLPSKAVLESNITGPAMCTTLSLERNIDSIEFCHNWSSCEEWCLSKSNKECSHVFAAARTMGTEIYLEGCDLTDAHFIDHKCNILEDEEDFNCKLFPSEKDSDGNTGTGDKDICLGFDNLQVQCTSGICKNYSSVYQCEFSNRLTDIENDWSDNGWDRGYCHCRNCKDESVAYPGNCPETISKCNRERPYDYYDNATVREYCEHVPCATCKKICHQRGQCFDMASRRDPTVIGTDAFGNPKKEYYDCSGGYCVEIYNLTCERRCDELEFNMKEKNTVIFSGERIIVADCSARSTSDVSRLNSDIPGQNTLLVSCTNITVDHDANSMLAKDCVNGTWFPDNFNGGKTNYSLMAKEFGKLREDVENRVSEIDYEMDITFYNKTKLKFNMEGCSNWLSEECTTFYDFYGRDGRNYTARAIFPCFYDPHDPDYVVINFNPDKTLMLLVFFAAIPGGILCFSCIYMCGCSRFLHVSDDGHMRLRCCGKNITGIGNVPVWDPPRRAAKFAHLRNDPNT